MSEEKAEIKELNDSIIWWTNRFNAVERDYEELKTKIDKAIEYIKKNSYGWETKYYDDDFNANELLEILGDKENEKT